MSRAGDLIAGRYQLEHEIASGGMGAVWKARHASLGTAVAIKFIKAEAARHASARARFAREAVLAAKINSTYSVKMLDHGEHEGVGFIAMEFLEGESLRQRIDQRGRLSLAETARVVRHVSRALTQAHDLGLVHRDIKPENLFVTRADDEEVIKVLDFGVAKVTDELSRDGVDPTKTGAMVGTPFYISPEQARGLKTVDYRADLWSLGVVAFECVTGRRPFTAPALGPLIAKITQGEIPRISSVLPGDTFPYELELWLARALARNPRERFASAREMAEAFTIASGIGESAPIESVPLGEPAPSLPAELASTVALTDTTPPSLDSNTVPLPPDPEPVAPQPRDPQPPDPPGQRPPAPWEQAPSSGRVPLFALLALVVILAAAAIFFVS